MDKKSRIKWIDTTKGIAIILLLLSHSMTKYNVLDNWIFAFHMPIFFIICGYLTKLKYHNGIKPSQFVNLLTNRWYNLFVPYFLFGTILILFFNVLKSLSETPTNISKPFVDLISMKGIESLWFLPIYFFSECLLMTIIGSFKEKIRLCIIITTVALLCMINQINLSWPCDLIYKVAEGTVFAFMGFIFATYETEKRITLISSVALLVVASCATLVNQGASMNDMRFALFYLINAIIISLCIICIIRRLGDKYGHNRIITFYGRNSLIVLCTNNLVIEICRLIDFKLFNNLIYNLGNIGVFLFFLIITVLEYPLLKLFEGKFSRQYILSLKGINRVRQNFEHPHN